MNITNLRSKISEFALEQTQNKPKTRYCGHLFSHLSRVWTYPHPRVDLFSYMGGGGVPREEDGIQIMDGFWQGKGSWQVELACLRRIISCLGHWGGGRGGSIKGSPFPDLSMEDEGPGKARSPRLASWAGFRKKGQRGEMQSEDFVFLSSVNINPPRSLVLKPTLAL
jgi:hypothetical protein